MNSSNPFQTPALLMTCALLLNAGTAAAQDFALQFRDGLVTLVVREVSVPRILDRWARIGGTRIVNGEAIQVAPVTLQLVDVPEREALAILLRDVGGYIMAERHDDAQGASVIDRILVLPRRAVPIRNLPPQPMAAPTVLSEGPEVSEPQPAGPDQTAEGAVAPPAPQGNGNGNGNWGSASMPIGAGTGSARPGELTTVPPAVYRPGPAPALRPGEIPAPVAPSRTSPGPQHRPQQPPV